MDKADAERIFTPAAQEALAAFPVAGGALRLVAVGENATFRVTDRQDGADYVLRLHRPGYHTLDELNAERVWIRALADAGIAVPRPVPARDGREYVTVLVGATGEHRHAGMAQWTEGQLLSDVLRDVSDLRVLEGYFEQLGAIAACLHNQSSAWRVPRTFRRHALDRDGLMGDAPFWGPFWEHALLSAAERRLLLKTRDRIRGVLDRIGRDPSTWSLIHADLHPGNVVVDGERLTVIDFDDAAFGWHQYDIAVALVHQQASPHFAAAEAAFLKGYRALRDISDAALALLPMFRLIRGMVQIGWYHQRPEHKPTAAFIEMKDRVCAQCAVFRPAG
ncbi:MAG: phosphotransferase [Alphaproteobacteria bacterium]|nr:phosphotransferase [Alphaproteobacteria bacterium]